MIEETKVQTNPISEPMNLKIRMTLIRLNLEPKIENKLVPICSKLEPDERENTSQTKDRKSVV